jgi:hypothetical protein
MLLPSVGCVAALEVGMLRTLISALALLLVFSSVMSAQKSWGKLKCQAPNPIYVVHVPDGPDHVMSVDQLKCTWIKPMEFFAIRNIDGVGTGCDDVNGRSIHTHGYFVDALENGDKVYWEVRGDGTLKPDGNLERHELHISVTGGTGRFSKATGQGTCVGSGNADSTSNWDCEIGIAAK